MLTSGAFSWQLVHPDGGLHEEPESHSVRTCARSRSQQLQGWRFAKKDEIAARGAEAARPHSPTAELAKLKAIRLGNPKAGVFTWGMNAV